MAMDIVSKLLNKLSNGTTSADTAQIKELSALATKISSEVRATSRYGYDLKPGQSETLNVLKKQPELQAQFARFLFTKRHTVMAPKLKATFSHHTHWPLFVTFTHLMRSNLQIEPDELLDWIIEFKGDKRSKLKQACQRRRNNRPAGRSKSRPVGAAPWDVMPSNSKHVPRRIGR